MRTGRILVVEDDVVARQLLVEVLEAEGHEVHAAESVPGALERVAVDDPEVVITDVRLGERNGIDLLRSLKASRPDLQVIVVTAFGSLQTAVEAIRDGAFDYLSKPFGMDEMTRMVRRALAALAEPVQRSEPVDEESDGILGRSRAMTEVFKTIARVAPLKSAVLVQGETGTGKELVARAIHAASERAGGPYLTVNCASLPENLLEAELFGYKKGAFTGAATDRKGLFEAAAGGTILLDEIGDMPLPLQAKLLRVLESGEVRPIGSTTPRSVDVRILASTHHDLERAVEAKSFRQDLFFRLEAVTLTLPPLRDRLDDLPLLAAHFLRRHAAAAKKPVEAFTDEALVAMRRYAWPGNVRELSNAIERAVALTKGRRIDVDDLPARFRSSPETAMAPPSARLDDVERAHILAVLKSVDGSRTRASQLLGIDRKTLYRKLLRYGLEEGDDEE